MCNLHLIELTWKNVKILLNKNITAEMNFQKLLQVTNDNVSLVTQDKMCRHLLSYRCSTITVQRKAKAITKASHVTQSCLAARQETSLWDTYSTVDLCKSVCACARAHTPKKHKCWEMYKVVSRQHYHTLQSCH